ncbi:hypothetical protein BAC2_00148 [uncultured bacterium]|nr:hypothetical protein BAC2_00148 [uncultured bacterium]
MHVLKLLLAFVALLTVGFIPVLSQDKKEGEGGGDIEEWKKANEPNENHKLLEKMAGNWDAEVTFIFDPTKEPEVNKTTSKKEMVLGGRFLHDVYEIKTGAMPHTGRGYMGYNNRTKKFQMMHMSTVDTAMEVEDGEYDAKAKTIIFKSALKEMEWGGQKIKYSTRMVYTLESDDKHSFSIFTTYPDMKEMEGKEIEEVKIVYTRKK